jgi:hypothetical protein
MFAATLVKHGRDVHIFYARQTTRHENLPGHIKYFSWFDVIGIDAKNRLVKKLGTNPQSHGQSHGQSHEVAQAPESPDRVLFIGNALLIISWKRESRRCKQR